MTTPEQEESTADMAPDVPLVPQTDSGTPVPDLPVTSEETTNAIPPYEPIGVQQQNVEGDPVNEPLVDASKNSFPLLAMPSALDMVLEHAQQHLPDGYVRPAHWANILTAAEGLTTNGEFEQALANPDAKWERKVMHGTARLTATAIGMPSIAGKEVSGDQAMMSWRAHSRSSAGGSCYFWSSGFHGKFNALPNERLYHLQREISSSRIEAGRATYGVALSQHMVYTAEAILQAARDAKFKSSLNPKIDLGDAIRITDFHTLVWSLAFATFPQGFDIERACIADPGNCHHTIKDRLNVRRMQIVDHNAISEEQRTWMMQLVEEKLTFEDLEKYQTMFPRLPTSEYELHHDNGRVSTIELRVPTLNEFIADGKLWIDDVNRAVIQTIGEKSSFNERNAMMTELMQVANARQYSHWVKSISFDGGKITDQDTIRRILSEEISSEDALLAAFIKAVRDFNEKMAISIIAINNFKCPSCDKHQMVVKGHEGEEVQPPTYVPVEAVSTFFALMYQKLEMAPR